MFFPDGKNISQGLRLSNVTMHIATFRGVCDGLGTHPVRLYLSWFCLALCFFFCKGASHQETTLGCYESYINLLEDEEEDIDVVIDKSLQEVTGTPLEYVERMFLVAHSY